MNSKTTYINVKPEERQNFIKGVFAMMEQEFNSLTKINRRICKLTGSRYDYIEEEENKKMLFLAEIYAKFLMGEISKADYVESRLKNMMNKPETEKTFRAERIVFDMSSREIEFVMPQGAIKKDVVKIEAAGKIAKCKGKTLEAVFRSKELANEVIRSLYTIQDQRAGAYLRLEDYSELHFGDIIIKKWMIAVDISKVEISDLLAEVKHFPDSAEFMRQKIAAIIVNEEYISEIYGDSIDRKIKREKLNEVLKSIKIP